MRRKLILLAILSLSSSSSFGFVGGNSSSGSKSTPSYDSWSSDTVSNADINSSTAGFNGISPNSGSTGGYILNNAPPISTTSSISSISSSGITGIGSVVSGYCHTSVPAATMSGMKSGFSNLESAIGSQISNATSILSETIQKNIAQASIANSQALEGQSEQEKRLFESGLAYDEQKEQAVAMRLEEQRIADELDVNKLNNTNACHNPGAAKRQSKADDDVKSIRGGGTQLSRNYGSAFKRTSESGDTVGEVIAPSDGSKPLDNVPPFTDVSPQVLTEEQVLNELKINAVLANPNSSPDIGVKNENLRNSAVGKSYTIAKRISDKKAEAVVSVLNYRTAMNSPTVEAPLENNFIMNELEKTYTNGLKDKDGNLIVTRQINSDNKTSLSALISAQVKQYHSNENWQKSLSNGKMKYQTKIDEGLKISALNLDISYRIYEQLLISNQLKALEMQTETSKNGLSLQENYDVLEYAN